MARLMVETKTLIWDFQLDSTQQFICSDKLGNIVTHGKVDYLPQHQKGKDLEVYLIEHNGPHRMYPISKILRVTRTK